MMMQSRRQRAASQSAAAALSQSQSQAEYEEEEEEEEEREQSQVSLEGGVFEDGAGASQEYAGGAAASQPAAGEGGREEAVADMRSRLSAILDMDPKAAEKREEAYVFNQSARQRRALREELRGQAAGIDDRRSELVQPEDGRVQLLLLENNALAQMTKQPREASMATDNLHKIAGVVVDKAKNVKSSLRDRDPGLFLARLTAFLGAQARPGSGAAAAAAAAAGGAASAAGGAAAAAAAAAASAAAAAAGGRGRGADAAQMAQLRDELNWGRLGRAVAQQGFLRPSRAPDCLHGPVAAPRATRARQARRAPVDKLAPIVRPEELVAQQQVTDATDKATERRVIEIKKLHRRLARAEAKRDRAAAAAEAGGKGEQGEEDGDKKKAPTPINFWAFVLNPRSFAQTVENVFHYAFLMRDGEARIAPGDPALLDAARSSTTASGTSAAAAAAMGCAPARAPTDADYHGRNTAIARIDAPLFNRLCELYADWTGPRIPHRDYDALGANAPAAAPGRKRPSETEGGDQGGAAAGDGGHDEDGDNAGRKKSRHA